MKTEDKHSINENSDSISRKIYSDKNELVSRKNSSTLGEIFIRQIK